jgi:hypothetical protein
VCSAHNLIVVLNVPDAEMVGLGFNPWIGHLGTWGFLGEVTDTLYNSEIEK